ncbi:MAG TPA: hydantoinase/oxoprolinase family protein [Actinomycetota bacterium]|nr:hydantoinase/oxoprolinase family protein [Actinomycetota bacterium]
MRGGWVVGIDVGGTFTDAIAMHGDGRLRISKVVSTPADPSLALVAALGELVEAGVDASSATLVFHGTTVATNALITGRLGRVVLLTTEGFRDVMAFRDGTRPALYDLQQPRPDELVGRDDRLEVRERLSSMGEAVEPLTEREIDRVVGEVVARRPEGVAVAFLFSYLNEEHEQRIADAVRRALPDRPVTASSEVAREFREYPRTATTVVNAGLRPIVGRYLERAADGIRGLGVDAPFLVMQSNGGCVPAPRAAREAHRLVLSGPTAGVTGAIALADRHNLDRIISFDMGGTSLDVCLVSGGVPPTTSTQVVEDHPILVPSVDIVTAGAGGGSIARVDRAGRLRVGPQSAGAVPGPAAYGLGGQEATLTDAHVVAGILGGDPLAGRVELDAPAAERAVAAVAKPLDLDPVAAAEGIIAVATAHGVRALRRVSVERGVDPRGFTLVAFGGAGPLLAGRVMDELGLQAVIVPPHPGLFSAAGLMAASLRIDDAQTVLRSLAPDLVPELMSWYRSATARLVAQLRADGIVRARVRVVASADCRYQGQGYELELPLGSVSAASIRGLRAAFDLSHDTMYGHADPDASLEVVTVRVSAFGEVDRHVATALPRGTRTPPAAARMGERRVVLAGMRGARRTAVYRRELLRARNVIEGPAILTEMDSTTVVGPGHAATVAADGSLWLRSTTR